MEKILEYICDYESLNNAEVHSSIDKDNVTISIDNNVYTFDNIGDEDWWISINTHLGEFDVNVYKDDVYIYPIKKDRCTDFSNWIYVVTEKK